MTVAFATTVRQIVSPAEIRFRNGPTSSPAVGRIDERSVLVSLQK